MRLKTGTIVAAGLIVAAGVGSYLLMRPNTTNAEPPPRAPADPPAAPAAAAPAAPQRPREEFASSRGAGLCDGDRALGYLEEICKIGPRISGTEGMKKQQDLLVKHFEGLGAKVTRQTFIARQVSRREPVEMTNLIISWHPDRQRRVLLCSHYDTRPIADQEDDRRLWTQPFVSANDGGSGVALLMELGHHMKDLKTAVGVDFVLFDGEEYIFNPSRMTGDRYFLGSEHFAEVYKAGKNQPRYIAALLFDMVAGKGARFPAEAHSWFHSAALVRDVWGVARDLKVDNFVAEVGGAVEDDHLALNRAGIPAIDIIDFSYPHWHRLSDTPANCSADSLEKVGRVVMTWLGRLR